MSVTITDQQYLVLCAASSTKPIYAENPSMVHAQMPDGSYPQPLRTVKSLVKRGLLKEDGRGGYLLTQAGESALQRR